MESDKDGPDGKSYAYSYESSGGLSSEKIPMTAPTWDAQFKKWNHPPGNSCTCGCGGGWSTSEKSLIK